MNINPAIYILRYERSLPSSFKERHIPHTATLYLATQYNIRNLYFDSVHR